MAEKSSCCSCRPWYCFVLLLVDRQAQSLYNNNKYKVLINSCVLYEVVCVRACMPKPHRCASASNHLMCVALSLYLWNYWIHLVLLNSNSGTVHTCNAFRDHYYCYCHCHWMNVCLCKDVIVIVIESIQTTNIKQILYSNSPIFSDRRLCHRTISMAFKL